MQLMKLGTILNQVAVNMPYERNDLYVEVYPLDISFNDPFTKIQLWIPVKQSPYDED